MERSEKRRKETWGLAGMLLIMGCFILIDLVATAIMQLLILSLTGAFLIINFGLMTVSALIIPLFVFVVTFEYSEWNDQQQEVYLFS